MSKYSYTPPHHSICNNANTRANFILVDLTNGPGHFPLFIYSSHCEIATLSFCLTLCA